MRHFKLFTVLAVLLLAFSGSALADSVTMTFLGPAGNNSGGVYTYPYLFSINGGTPVSLVCDTFDNEVVAGETWQATVSGITSGNGLFGGQLLNYKAAGLIFQGMVNGTISANVGNWAIWGLFSANPASNSYFTSSGAANLISQYLALAAITPNSALANIVLYTPIAGTQSWNASVPQEFIGIVSVPEPATIVMLIALAAGVAGLFFFRQRLGLRLVQQA